MSHSTHTRGSFDHLPFGEFIALLRTEGFVIEVNDLTEFVRLFQEFAGDSTPDRLKYYLAPLVCRSPAEQAKFYQLFDNFYFERTKRSSGSDVKGRSSLATEWRDPAVIIPACLFALTLLALSHLFRISIFTPPILVSTRKDSLWKGNPIHFSAAIPPITDPSVRLATQWQFGDGLSDESGAAVEHRFSDCGVYDVTILCWDGATGKELGRNSMNIVISAPVLLKNDSGKNVFNINDTVSIRAQMVDSPTRARRGYWTVTDATTGATDTIYNGKYAMTYVCREAGRYTASFVFEDQTGCDKWPGIDFSVSKRRHRLLVLKPGGKPIPKELRTTTSWIVVFLVLQMVFISLYLYDRYRRRRRLRLRAPEENFGGIAPPTEIPMLPKNGQIVRVQGQAQISTLLLQRAQSELPELDIPRTLRRTINRLGFITPEYRLRHRDRNYLLLIDGKRSGSQTVHLFRYLVQTFLADNINLNYYIYYNDPFKLFQENSPVPIHVGELRNKNYGAILVILGNGHQFLDDSLPEVRSVVRESYRSWDKRILITPVAANDWNGNERILSTFFNLIPADLEGLLHLVKFINEDLPGDASFRIDEWKTYPAMHVNTGSVAALEKYLDDEDLVQWICAIAVYHTIRWEVMIDIGKHVLAANNAAGKLNYSSLLKIARIKWIREGSFPTDLRTQLLARLTVQNELIARKVMLNILNESDLLIGIDSFAYEEKMIQRYTDSFILYANDREGYAVYKEDAERFMALWQRDSITDSSLVVYLENSGHRWTTPINSYSGQETNVPVKSFISAAKKTRARPPFMLFLAYVVMCGLFITPILSPASFVASRLNALFHFITREYPRSGVKITVLLPGDKCLLQFFRPKLRDSVSLIRKGDEKDIVLTSIEIPPRGNSFLDYDSVYFNLSYSDAQSFSQNTHAIGFGQAVDYGQGDLTGNEIYSLYTVSVATADCGGGP